MPGLRPIECQGHTPKPPSVPSQWLTTPRASGYMREAARHNALPEMRRVALIDVHVDSRIYGAYACIKEDENSPGAEGHTERRVSPLHSLH
jgi:hypothetical protein